MVRWRPFLARRRTQCPPSEQIGQLTEMCFTLITVQQQDLIQYQRANILSPTSRIAPRLVAGNTHSPSGGSLFRRVPRVPNRHTMPPRRRSVICVCSMPACRSERTAMNGVLQASLHGAFSGSVWESDLVCCIRGLTETCPLRVDHQWRESQGYDGHQEMVVASGVKRPKVDIHT